MQAILVNEPGGSEKLQLQEVVTPKCKPDEVLVEIKAAGINYIDVYIRTGLYPSAQYPYTPGKEGSGIITTIGENVKEFKVGDRVAFSSGGSGSYAQYTAIPAAQVVPIPASLSFEIAAAAMLQGLTAYYLSHLTFPLNKNHTALIHAGAGGVGLLLIQLAKSIGAQVITTVSTADKAKLAQAAGADEVVIYTQDSFVDVVMQNTHNRGVDVVYDAVGKTTFDDSLKSLAIRGMLVSYGQASGPVPPVPLSKLAEKSLYLTRPSLSHYTRNQQELTDLAAKLFALISGGKLKITIGQKYTLAEAVKAHNDLEARKTIGKSLLLL